MPEMQEMMRAKKEGWQEGGFGSGRRNRDARHACTTAQWSNPHGRRYQAASSRRSERSAGGVWRAARMSVGLVACAESAPGGGVVGGRKSSWG